MMQTLIKYIRIFYIFSRVTFMNTLASRWTLIIAVITKMLRTIFLVIFFQAVFLHIATFSGWTFQEILILSATYLTLEHIAIITFHRNLSYYFPKSLQDGNFDFVLTKPVNPLFHAAFRVIDWYDITSLPPVIILWGYIISHYSLDVSIISLLLFIIFLCGAIVFYFSLLLIIASTAFWTINATGVGRFIENILRISRYPTTMFQGTVRFIFLFIVPITFFVTLPSQILLSHAHTSYIVFAFVFIALTFLSAMRFWKYALIHYSSASS